MIESGSITGIFGNILTSRGDFAVLKREFPVALPSPTLLQLFLVVFISYFLLYFRYDVILVYIPFPDT